MEWIPNTSGVYQIRNIVNGKVYVGSAVYLRRRWNRHLSYLRNNAHANKKLQYAFNKYGENNFVFEILEEVSDKTQLTAVEQKYIDKLDAVHSGYNIRLIAESNLGLKYSEEAKAHMREAQSHRSEETKRRMLEARRRRPPISEETRQKMKEAQSHRSEETRKRMGDALRGRTIPDEVKQRISETLRNKVRASEKPVFCVELNKRYKNITVASRETNTCRSSIVRCLRGKRHTAGGYHWKEIS